MANTRPNLNFGEQDGVRYRNKINIGVTDEKYVYSFGRDESGKPIPVPSGKMIFEVSIQGHRFKCIESDGENKLVRVCLKKKFSRAEVFSDKLNETTKETLDKKSKQQANPTRHTIPDVVIESEAVVKARIRNTNNKRKNRAEKKHPSLSCECNLCCAARNAYERANDAASQGRPDAGEKLADYYTLAKDAGIKTRESKRRKIINPNEESQGLNVESEIDAIGWVNSKLKEIREEKTKQGELTIPNKEAADNALNLLLLTPTTLSQGIDFNRETVDSFSIGNQFTYFQPSSSSSSSAIPQLQDLQDNDPSFSFLNLGMEKF